MAAKFLKYAFGIDGDLTPVPNTTQVDGSVSYQEGFGPDYQRVDTDSLYKAVPRDQFNEILFDISGAVQQYQTHGVPDFITSSDNDGTPYSYDILAKVLYDDGGGIDIYTSLQNSNTALPSDATKWRKGDNQGITATTGDVVATGPGVVPATIQNNAVTTPKINAQAVTLPKITAIPAYSVIVNATNASASPTAVALSNKQLLGLGDTTTGTFGAITVGTGLDIVGNQLINTAIPSPSPPQSTVVSWGTAQTSRTISLDFSTYSSYEIEIDGIFADTSSSIIQIDGSTNNFSTTATKNIASYGVSGAAVADNSGGLVEVGTSSSGVYVSCFIKISQATLTSQAIVGFTGQGFATGVITGGGAFAVSSAINALKFSTRFAASGGSIKFTPTGRR